MGKVSYGLKLPLPRGFAWEHLATEAAGGLSCALFRSQECKLLRAGSRDDAAPGNPEHCSKALGLFGTTTQAQTSRVCAPSPSPELEAQPDSRPGRYLAPLARAGREGSQESLQVLAEP